VYRYFAPGAEELRVT